MAHDPEITTEDPNFNQLRNIVLPDAKKQPDRSLVIVMAAVIEDHLAGVIVNHLVDAKKITDNMFGGMGPLSTFSAKIDMGFLLGLYTRDFLNALHALRKVRNEFAHNMGPITLDSDEVMQKSSPLLQIVERFHHRPKTQTTRETFIGSCEFLLGGLAAMGLDTRRLKSPEPGQKATRTPV